MFISEIKKMVKSSLHMKSIFVVFLLFYSGSVVLGQESISNRKNLIFVEGGGAFAAGTGLGYERYLGLNDLTRFSARGGAGLIDHFSLPTFFAGSSFMYGKKFQAEVGLNYITNIDLRNFRPLDEDEPRIVDGLQTLVGLRYQNWENGLSFRVFYVPPFMFHHSVLLLHGFLMEGYL